MKTEALEVLRNRRSIRKYTAEQVGREQLLAVLEAGTYAPSAKGRQPARIVVVQRPEVIRQLSKMNADILGAATDPYFGAPTILLVFAPKDLPTAEMDAACVMQNMLLAAYAVGLGSCWINREKQMFETPQGKALMQQWGVSDDYMGVAGMSLGYPEGEHPAAKERKADFVVFAE